MAEFDLLHSAWKTLAERPDLLAMQRGNGVHRKKSGFVMVSSQCCKHALAVLRLISYPLERGTAIPSSENGQAEQHSVQVVVFLDALEFRTPASAERKAMWELPSWYYTEVEAVAAVAVDEETEPRAVESDCTASPEAVQRQDLHMSVHFR